MLKNAIRAGVRFGLRNKRVRGVVEAELASRRAPLTTESATGRAFVDHYGVSHPLDGGIRDRLKPGWQAMLDPAEATRPPSAAELRLEVRRAADTVREASQIVAAATGLPLTGRLLEIGCYDGAVAFQFAGRDGNQVVASDLARYYVVQRPGQPNQHDLAAQQAMLAEVRERARLAAGIQSDRVRFVEDDACESNLDPASFDSIVSFEVLEHVESVDAAFASMARLLVRGGIAYHVYNPFFSVIGGHALCTLDMAWGHARLDSADFERYLAEIRPAEVDQALRFYRESLNRVTLADLRKAAATAHLELVALMPWPDRTLATALTPQIASEAQRAYPSVTIEDLLSTYVTVVLRKSYP